MENSTHICDTCKHAMIRKTIFNGAAKNHETKETFCLATGGVMMQIGDQITIECNHHEKQK